MVEGRIIMIGQKPTNMPSVKGFHFVAEDDAGDLETRSQHLATTTVTMPRGLLASLYSGLTGRGLGSAEKRAYNGVRYEGLKLGADVAIVKDIAYGSDRGTQLVSVHADLYKQN